jgi:hypothetical protein
MDMSAAGHPAAATKDSSSTTPTFAHDSELPSGGELVNPNMITIIF